jgi:hypothetical protein
VWQVRFDWIKTAEYALISDRRVVIRLLWMKKEGKVLDRQMTPARHRLSNAGTKEILGRATKRTDHCQLHLHPLRNHLPDHPLYPTIISPLSAVLLLEEI